MYLLSEHAILVKVALTLHDIKNRVLKPDENNNKQFP